ncbi:guanine nucleotide-binding protein G(I)/G(S)/G(O) subunit gamma-4 isoform X1 [Scophthalmus maximus]|uniref:GNG-4 n=1 Tax=Scophthalmus maximus TaxID=52904 RepID=A0A8K1PTN8_SCOMX|nr:guanine nucleotide-binding protein G(I)/G(S)/G(O) subunit gamma-4 isoform X1 [Scophthalmus maximus]UDP83107.1 GNG-4 [Scophthalmus maximus]
MALLQRQKVDGEDGGEEWTDLLQSIMKDGIANNSTASISHARKAVEQLKMEACMDRIKKFSIRFFQVSCIRGRIAIVNNNILYGSQSEERGTSVERDKAVVQLHVSKAAADLMAYCDAHIREDPLIVPVPASENPFREKKFFCTIL